MRGARAGGFIKAFFVLGAFLVSAAPAAGKAPGLDPLVQKATWAPEHLGLQGKKGASAKLEVVLARPARVRIAIVGPDGRRVRTLLAGQIWPAGSKTLTWDGKDDQGEAVPSEAYMPSVAEFQKGRWIPVYEPNAENHGLPVPVSGVQWNPAEGVFVLSVPAPARLRVWAVHGDDGLVLSSLKDLEPVEAGIISLRWRGRDEKSGADVRGWGNASFHTKAYTLPASCVIVENGDPRAYLAHRSRYPLQPSSAPRPYPDSSPLYRMEYAEQRELLFSAQWEGDSLVVRPDPTSQTALSRGKPALRVFRRDGMWKQFDLSKDARAPGVFRAKLGEPKAYQHVDLALLLSAGKDQFGHWFVPGEGSGGGASPR